LGPTSLKLRGKRFFRNCLTTRQARSPLNLFQLNLVPPAVSVLLSLSLIVLTISACSISNSSCGESSDSKLLHLKVLILVFKVRASVLDLGVACQEIGSCN
jgi:hypothetical protein